MSLPLTGENLKKAFCGILACTGIGSAISNCDDLFDKKVWVVVPLKEQPDYPERLLVCAKQICENAPYNWGVDEETASIDSEITFKNLYQNWFKNIVS